MMPCDPGAVLVLEMGWLGVALFDLFCGFCRIWGSMQELRNHLLFVLRAVAALARPVAVI
jgi:hypothetical protein